MTLSPLLPVRHKQGDFFIADIFDNLPYKDDTGSMEHPMFSLSQKPDMRILRYVNGNASIEIQPSAYGLPNMMDKDILLYCASVTMAKINEGEIPPQTIRLSLRDVLIATNRHANNDGYKYIKTALNRLTGCMLKTNIKTGRVTQGKMFHLLEHAEYLESTRVKGRILGVEVKLSDWFYNSLIAKEVLTISPEYFRLRKSLDRRIYEIARKHCGRQKRPWSIGLDKLHLKSGTMARQSHFRNTIKNLADSNHLPEYSLSFNVETDVVTFHHRRRVGSTSTQNDLLYADGISKEVTPIPPDLLEEVRQLIGDGADYYTFWEEYLAWKGSKSARNIRSGFVGFCRKKVLSG